MIQKLYRKKYLVVFFVALCGLAMFISAPKALALYTTAQINAKLEDGTATAVGFDNANCRTNLYNNRSIGSSGDTLRSSINGDGVYRSASYYDKSWLSDVNTPNTNNPVVVPWGAGSAAVGGIPLQVNSVTFLCGPLVSPETYGPSPSLPKNPYSLNLYNQTSRWVLSASNANDRAPNPIGGSNMEPARVDTYSQIVSFSVAGRPGASLTGSGSTLYIKRDNNSRYWFSAPVKVTYSDPAGITSLTTVKITMTYKTITGYWGYTFPPRIEKCEGSTSGSANLNFTNCDTRTSTLNITFKPNPLMSATTVANPKTIYPSQSSTFTHTIRETGSRNVGFVWRTCGGWYASKPAANVAPPTCTGYAAGSATTTAPLVRTHVVPGDATKLLTTPWYCERIVYAVTATSAPAGASTADCFKMQPLAVSCGAFSTQPDTVDPKTVFSATVGVVYPPAMSVPAGTMSLKFTPVSAGATWTYTSPTLTTPVGGSSPIEKTFSNIGPTNQTGIWNVTWTYTDINGSKTCDTEAQLVVTNKPYLRVYGGDTVAGSAAAETDNGQSCVANSDAGVYSWNNRDAGFSGAGAQYAVMALGQILDYSSASELGAGTNGTPAGLSFANDGLDSSTQLKTTLGLFGGSFEGTVGTCDFTSDIGVDPTNPGTIPATTVLPGVQNVQYVVGHDVYISGNIVYSGTGGWASIDQIPYFKLVVVGGNIYIDKNVTQLDGLYIAEAADDGSGTNTMTGGTIYTCATGSGLPVDFNLVAPAASTFYSQCGNKLTVNGAFAAQQIQFLRTFGTVGAATTDAQASNNAAEVFNYSPEVWLPRTANTTIVGKYDAITGLPPVL